jgi:hypothetical protein
LDLLVLVKCLTLISLAVNAVLTFLSCRSNHPVIAQYTVPIVTVLSAKLVAVVQWVQAVLAVWLLVKCSP